MKNYLKLLACGIMLFACTVEVQAQKSTKPFFGKTFLVPPAKKVGPRGAMAMLLPATTGGWDTSFFQLKPVGGVAYSFPNYQAQAVTGLSYQHIKYKYQTDVAPAEDFCDYSVNVLLSLGATTLPSAMETNVSSFGLGLGVLNNKITLCALLNSYKSKTDPQSEQKTKLVGAIMYTF